MLKKLTPFLSKYKLFACLGPLFICAEVLLEIRIPLLMAKIVDIGIPGKDIHYVMQTGAMMLLFALLGLVCGGLASIFSARASMGFGSEVRFGLFEKIQNFSFANVDKFSTASLITRLTTDVNNTQNAILMMLRLLIRAPFMLVGAMIMAYSINSSLVGIFFISVPFLAIVLVLIAVLAFPRFGAMLKKYDALNGSIQENLIAIRAVKAFVRSVYEKTKFKSSNDDLMRAAIRAERVVIWGAPAMQLTMYSSIIAILWIGGNMIISGSMLTGELISFISYVTQILVSLMMISMVFIMLVLSRASASRIIEVLDEPIDINDSHADQDAQVADGSIVFEGVSFRYGKHQSENVLEQINLTIASGETIGIIGGTGSAKTSLVQLIPRLYDVTEGRILVGGRDVRDYSLQHLRNAVSMVLQQNVLFSGTIEENLKWGDEQATQEEIETVCLSAQAHDFIQSFPEGYQTDLGQGGVNVSGGQKQRLCIARALLKKPKIIILDDSTSAVDTATDSKIRAAFRENLKGTTTIIIAQRISSVSDADKIIVLDDGKINAVGTHEQLLETNEIYQEVYHSQQKGGLE